MTKKNKISELSNQELRKYLIETTLEAIDLMKNKAFTGRIRNPNNEKIRIDQLKVVINGCNVANRILKDNQLDKLENDIKILEDGLIQKVEKDNLYEDASSETLMEIEALTEEIEAMKNED